MADLLLIIVGMVMVAATKHAVELTDEHPAARVLWVLTGAALFPFNTLLATGYISGIAGFVLGDAVRDWLDMTP